MTAALRKQYNIRDNVNGVVVTTVTPNSPAAEKRVQPATSSSRSISRRSGPSDVVARMAEAKKQGRKSILFLVANAQGEVRFVALPVEYDSSRSLLNGRACPGHFRLSLYSAIQSDSHTPARREAREVAEVDARVSSRRDGGLCVKRHAKARFLQHGEIVGAVADSHGLFRLEAIHVAQFDQCCELRFAPKDGSTPRRQTTVFDNDVLARFFVEADCLRNLRCEQREAAGDERRVRAVCAHRAHERAPAVRQRMRSSITCATTPASNPFNSATRSRSAGSKAISPRIARSVMAET